MLNHLVQEDLEGVDPRGWELDSGIRATFIQVSAAAAAGNENKAVETACTYSGKKNARNHRGRRNLVSFAGTATIAMSNASSII